MGTTKMAYQVMYEGDGFIRKGPEPKATGKEQRISASEQSRPETKQKARGGITMFRFTRMVFGR
jgi:hypothetical protein